MATTRRARLAAVMLIAALGVGGCVPGAREASPESDAAAQSQRAPDLDQARIDGILRDTQSVLDAADKSGDAHRLSARADGAALRMRRDLYASSKKTGERVEALDLSPQGLAVTNDAGWPRAIFVFTKAPQGDLPAVAVFRQAAARDPYKLVTWMRLLGGTEITAEPVDRGSGLIAQDQKGYALSPGDAIAAYVTRLNDPASAEARQFTTDEFASTYTQEVKSLNSSVKAAGSVKAKARPVDLPVLGIRLAGGQALVAGSFTYTQTYARTVAHSSMRLGGTPAAILGGDAAVKGTVTVSYLVNVLLVVPPRGSDDKIQVVGAERAIESVKRDDSKKPRGE